MSVLLSRSEERDLATDDARLIRTSIARLQRRLRAARADVGIGLSAYSALGCIYRDGPLSAGQLASREHLQPQSLTRILARLEQRGFIRRAQDKEDLRRAQLQITRSGLQFLHRNALHQDAWLSNAITRALTEPERAMLRIATQLLDRIAASPE